MADPMQRERADNELVEKLRWDGYTRSAERLETLIGEGKALRAALAKARGKS